MKEESIDIWFWRWLQRHQDLCRYDVMTRIPDERGFAVEKLISLWVAATDRDFYAAWLGLFREQGIARRQALEISSRLQINRPSHPDRHPEAIKDQLREIRRIERDKAAIQHAGFSRPIAAAIPECLDCPECEGTGLARRKWSSPGLPAPIMVNLTCRCPAGIRRRESSDRPDFADLQSLPDLWAPWLSHPSWSPVPVEPPSHLPTPDGWYLQPSEPAQPEPVKKRPRKPARRSSTEVRPGHAPDPQGRATADARPLLERLRLVGCTPDPIIDREIALYAPSSSASSEQPADSFVDGMEWI